MKTRVMVLPDGMLDQLLESSTSRLRGGMSRRDNEEIWNRELREAVRLHGFPDPRFNPDPEAELAGFAFTRASMTRRIPISGHGPKNASMNQSKARRFFSSSQPPLAQTGLLNSLTGKQWCCS